MSGGIARNFSHTFGGAVWNLVAVPGRPVLLLEVRDQQAKRVSFTALDYQHNTFLWRDRVLEEPWWINLSAAAANEILFTVYTDTNNPDKKSVIACAVENLDLLWWKNDFSVLAVQNNRVWGVSSKISSKAEVLDVHSGLPVADQHPSPERGAVPRDIVRPAQYTEGTPYFDTVKTFLERQLNLIAVTALEYLEHNGLIFVSCYTANADTLENHWIVLSAEGHVVTQEKLSTGLKGIGLDTFFILAGCVFFVKNKVELVSYKFL